MSSFEKSRKIVLGHVDYEGIAGVANHVVGQAANNQCEGFAGAAGPTNTTASVRRSAKAFIYQPCTELGRHPILSQRRRRAIRKYRPTASEQASGGLPK